MKRSEVEDEDNGFRYYTTDAGDLWPHVKECTDVLDEHRVCYGVVCGCGCHFEDGEGPFAFIGSFLF